MSDDSSSDEELAERDTEEALIAALQESDTAVETLHDTSQDHPRSARRRRGTIGLAGLLLALLALVVARRRR
jgi:hypothetical protein